MYTILSSSRSPCFRNLHCSPTIAFIPFISSLASLAHYHILSPTTNPNPEPKNPLLFNYLIESFGIPNPRALSVSNRFSFLKTTERPQSVVEFLKHLGFSDAHIQNAARVAPQILFFTNVDKNLKPKLLFFQELGLIGPDLGKFIAKNSSVLTCSLEKILKPRIEVLKKILINDHNNEDLILVIQRSSWVASKYSDSRILSNASYLESCGIVGTQLSFLLKRQSWLFIMREPDLKDLVSRVLDMGFAVNSRMLVHALYTVSCMSNETFRRKFELFKSFGFSEDECMQMFKSTPMLYRTSEEKLKLGLEFYLNHVKFDKILLVRRPTSLMHSIEERVIPRYRVLQIMKSKRLLKKEPRFLTVVALPEEEFLEKFISRFTDHAEELLVAYKGHLLDSSEEE